MSKIEPLPLSPGDPTAPGRKVKLPLRWGFLASAVAVVTGCASLPSDGPSTYRIEHKEEGGDKKDKPFPYQLITITTPVIVALKKSEKAASTSGLSTLASPTASDTSAEKLFRVTGIDGLPLPTRQTIAPGDVVNVTIFASGGGLFGPVAAGSGSGSGSLPAQTVDASGFITVPYAGQVQVIGRTTFEVEQDIVARLKDKAIDPQAVVTITQHNGGNLVTVTGDVKTPTMVPVVITSGSAPVSSAHAPFVTQVPATTTGTRLLDALTTAGGSTGEAHETTVTVVRGTESRTELLSDVLANISDNIPLQPNDTVILRYRPWTFLAFGVLLKSGTFPFGKPDLSLAEALASTGGPNGLFARPIIYLYRQEPTLFVKQLGETPIVPSAPLTPVIYQIDLRDPQGFFLAQSFAIRNKDILFVSTAPSVGLTKFFDVINALTTPVRNGLSSGISTSSSLGP